MAKAVVVWPRPWGRCNGLGGVAEALRVNANPNPKAVGRSQGNGGMAKDFREWLRPLRGCQDRWGVAKVVGAWPRTWGLGQSRECVAKAVGYP